MSANKLRKHKILIISAVFPPEPVTTAYMNHDLAIALQGRYDVTVLRAFPSRPVGSTYSDDDLNKDLPYECITLKSFTCPTSSLKGRLRESISFGLACKRYIKEHCREIDYIYNASWQLFGYFIVAKTAVSYSIPYMVPIQDIYPESLFTGKNYPKLFKLILTAILKPLDCYYQRHAHKVRTITDEMRDYLSSSRQVPLERYLVVNNWQENNLFNYSESKESALITFAYVGSVNNHSNTEYLIESFLNTGLNNARLIIYGTGNRADACVKLVKQHHAENKVFFGSVKRDDVPRVQSEADVLVLALPKENARFSLPSKITSYMLSGRPILASIDEMSASSRYIVGSNSGIAVPPDNKERLTKAFKTIAHMNVSDRNIMGRNGRSFALEHLTKEANLSIVVSEITNQIEKKIH